MNEEQYLKFVIDIVRTRIKEIDGKISDNKQDIENMHDYFWENYAEFDEYGYEKYDNSNALKIRLSEQENYKKDRIRYKKMLDSPYFGRVDFCYEGEEEPETYYIGIGNLAESRRADPYVFDWRAPVSGLFYEYDRGPASFLAPAGRMAGEITKKRQYKIKDGKLLFVLENDEKIDDEILQQALAEHGSESLRSIVTTIQKEQNQIIRDDSHRILAVQGCAGSGKTSVALHRMAYLLYHNRGQLSAAQILILSPNSIFADYISRILPELGEENIREMTLDHFAYHSLKAYGETEDYYDELERLLRSRGSDSGSGEAQYKQTRGYREELDGFLLSLEWELMEFSDFHYKKMAMSEARITEFFYEKLCDVPILSRMEKIGEYLIDQEETLLGRTIPEEEKQDIIGRLNRMYETRDLILLYNRFLQSTGRQTLDVSGGKIRYEDVYPLLYLHYVLSEQPKRRQVKHLLIDEMQDYSYLQYVILAKMFDCPMTILGDQAQTMAEEKQDVRAFLPEIFGKQVYLARLEKSYRSTCEIMAFAGSLAGENKLQAIERHGESPKTAVCPTQKDMYERLAFDLDEETNAQTVGVLCLNAKLAEQAAEILSDLSPGREICLLTKDSMAFRKGILVMPFYLAKGLEFDAVFVPDLQEYQTPLHRQALYINATRALHVLRLYRVGD